MNAFDSLEQLIIHAEEAGLPLWQHIQQADCRRQGISPEESWEKMAALWKTKATGKRTAPTAAWLAETVEK